MEMEYRFISVFLCMADWIYFYALTLPGAMISIVSMVRRSNVLVTFAAGWLIFKEKNLKSKAVRPVVGVDRNDFLVLWNSTNGINGYLCDKI